MIKKGDIVTYKNHRNKPYRKLHYKVTYVNKRSNYVWVRVPYRPYSLWKLNLNDLVKVEE